MSRRSTAKAGELSAKVGDDITLVRRPLLSEPPLNVIPVVGQRQSTVIIRALERGGPGEVRAPCYGSSATVRFVSMPQVLHT